VSRLPATTMYLLAEFWLSAAFRIAFTITAVYFVVDVGLNPLELVLVGTALEAAVFVFEVPTGVVADRFGRRRSVIIGWLVQGGAIVLVGLVPSVGAILAGYALRGFGHTFTSGAFEAWITDEVGVDQVRSVFLRGARIAYAGAFLGIPLSVVLGATLGLGTAIAIGGGLVAAFAVLALVWMPEHGFHPPSRDERTTVGDLLGTASDGARLIRAQPVLLLMLAIFFFAGMSTEGFDRLWEAHLLRDVGLPSLGSLEPVYWFGILNLAALALALVGSTVLIRRLEHSSRSALARMLFAITFVQLLAFLVFGSTTALALAIVGFVAYRLTRALVEPLELSWLNENIPDSRVRATVISITNQADAIGQVGGGPAIGVLGTAASIRAALVSSALVLLPALGLFGRAIRHEGAEPELQELPEPAGS
jgi:DHA3 family tetracycline resistance protein-like MFS transporter